MEMCDGYCHWKTVLGISEPLITHNVHTCRTSGGLEISSQATATITDTGQKYYSKKILCNFLTASLCFAGFNLHTWFNFKY